MGRKIIFMFCTKVTWIFITLLLLTGEARTQTTSVIIQGKEYRYENGKWYTYFQNRLGDEIIPERLVVRLSDRGYLEDFDFEQLDLQGVSLASPRYLNGFYVLSLPELYDPFDIAKTLESTGLFDEMHFDALGRISATPDDPSYSEQWALDKIQMNEAWNLATGSSEIIVAIIDVGFNWSHEDLAENLWQNLGEDANQNGKTVIFSNGEWIFDPDDDLDDQDNDGNGKLNDLIGWDFVNDDNSLEPGNNHGTIVSGVAAAKTFNGKGIAGVAGGWENQKGVSLMMLQVSLSLDVAESAISQAIEYAVQNGAKVINMSIAISENYPDVETAVDMAAAADVIMVVSAGNNGGDESPDPTMNNNYPARYPETITVGATDQNDERWVESGTKRGSAIGSDLRILDLVAPGKIIKTTSGSGYASPTGTSVAAPHVAGLAALIAQLILH